MTLRTAYTFMLLQFPPLAVGIVAVVAGFLGSALPAIRLERFQAGVEAVEGGLRWGGLASALVALVLGLAVLVLLRRGDAGCAARRKAALSVGTSALTGWLGAVLAASAGTLAGSRVSLDALTAELGHTWWAPWPVVVVALAMGTAIGLTAVGAPPTEARTPR